MFSILSWCIVGVVAGLIARALYPGHQNYSLLATMALGIAGALLGGYLASTLLGIGVAAGSLSLGALVASVAGAMLLILLLGLIK